MPNSFLIYGANGYTGELIESDKALNSAEDLTPQRYEFGEVSVPEVAMPGRTKFA